MNYDNFEKVDNDVRYGAKLLTKVPFKRNELVVHITEFKKTKIPNYQSIQVNREEHIIVDEFLSYLNHSCRPTLILDTATLKCYATRAVEPGEELTFFYPSTEWMMAQPLVCLCGSPECIRLVAGAKFLSLDGLSRYYINRHIREQALEILEKCSHPGTGDSCGEP